MDSDKPVEVYQRHLPHWRQPGATYFVTYRLADSLPQEKPSFLKRLRAEWERTHPPPRSEQDWEEHTRDVIRRTEAWLDEGYGACYFRQPGLAALLEEALMHFQDQRYFVSCWTVMPNHVHLVICPFNDWPLEDVLQGMKGVVARNVNQLIGGSGSIWQEESFDRIVREEEHLWRVIQYIGRNPSQARIPREQWRRRVHPTWQAVGWDFIDERT